MEKTNKKECPKCKSSDIEYITKIEKRNIIIRSSSQEYPKITDIFDQYKCNKCGDYFEFYQEKIV